MCRRSFRHCSLRSRFLNSTLKALLCGRTVESVLTELSLSCWFLSQIVLLAEASLLACAACRSLMSADSSVRCCSVQSGCLPKPTNTQCTHSLCHCHPYANAMQAPNTLLCAIWYRYITSSSLPHQIHNFTPVYQENTVKTLSRPNIKHKICFSC